MREFEKVQVHIDIDLDLDPAEAARYIGEQRWFRTTEMFPGTIIGWALVARETDPNTGIAVHDLNRAQAQAQEDIETLVQTWAGL